MEVIIDCIGGVCGHGDRPGSHDRKIGQEPFGAVFRHQNHPIAGGNSQPPQTTRQGRDLGNRVGPGDRREITAAGRFPPEKRFIRENFRLRKEHCGQIPNRFEVNNR